MRYILISFISFLLFSCSSKEKQQIITVEHPLVTIESKKTEYIAGDHIKLVFKTSKVVDLKLQLKNAYGNVLINPTEINGALVNFNIPKNYSRLAGPCHWKLLHTGNILLSGTVSIATNKTEITHLESYFGPRSVTAGYNDYSMLTIAPTDVYDNPLDNDTPVTIKYQFLENISDLQVTTENFIAWYNVRSTTKSGRILVTSECNGTTSKELTTIVFPSNATNFNISASSAHNYADGNQILTFKSDIIRDEFGNMVSDGTLVTFVIKNEKGAHLYTVGTTLNGIVEARTLHPDYPAKWEVQAFITGAAQSNLTNFNFQSAIKDYPVTFSKGNRHIEIGSFESFMNQLVPDGILVQLDIYNKDLKFIETKKTTTKNGSSTIYLGAYFLPNGTYTFKIKAAGITKEYTKKLHGN